MKLVTFLLSAVFILSSCCKEYDCVHGLSTLTVKLKNFDSIEIDSAILLVYLKNNEFDTLIEKRQQPGLYQDTTNNIVLGGSTYDYALKIIADTFFISGITEIKTTFRSVFGALPKMGTCQISDNYIIKGKNMRKNGNTIIITK